MKCLYIDLASNKGLLALVTEESVMASDHVDQRMGDQELMPRLEGLLQIADCKWDDLTHIACVIGPGGFMSLRVGVALANTLSDQLKIPIVGIPLVDLYAARSMDTCGIWIHSTKKQEVFVRSLSKECITFNWPSPMHMNVQEAIESIPLSLCWCGELIPEHHTIIDTHGIQECPLLPLEEILPGFLIGQTYKNQILEPWYGRGW